MLKVIRFSFFFLILLVYVVSRVMCSKFQTNQLKKKTIKSFMVKTDKTVKSKMATTYISKFTQFSKHLSTNLTSTQGPVLPEHEWLGIFFYFSPYLTTHGLNTSTGLDLLQDTECAILACCGILQIISTFDFQTRSYFQGKLDQSYLST